MSVPFVQVYADGRRRDTSITRTRQIEAMAREIGDLGYGFLIRQVGRGYALEAWHQDAGEPFATEECPDGWGLIDAVDRLVMRAFVRARKGVPPAPPEGFEAA